MKQESLQARQADTRQKIMMGGLVVKAGLTELHHTNPEVILGILMDARDKINNPSDFSKWEEIGLKELFTK
jgi:hypothetical protein